MQISGVSLALTWPHRLCLLRVLLCMSLCYKLSPFQALGKVTLHPHSQACMFSYSSRGRWVFPPLLCSFPPTATFTSFPAPDYWRCCCSCQPPCLFTVHMGSGSSPLSCAVFLPLPLSQAFPLLVAGRTPLLLLESLQPGPACLFTVLGSIPFLPLRCSGRPTLFPTCIYCSYCLLLSFSFFPGWR
jgi:hypothetical protein